MEDSTSPYWAHLPLAAVRLISQKIKCITDYVQFRAVCSPWSAASLPKPCHLPHQLPWLMVPSPKLFQEDDGIRLFYDLWEAKMRKIHLPETIDKVCCASYRGWLLLVARGGSELFLLNPLTRARVELPPFTIPVKHIWDGDEEDIRRWGVPPPRKVDYLFKSMMGDKVITKVTFSTDLTDPNCVIMVFFQRFKGIFFCKVGDCCWTQVAQPPAPTAELADAAYNNGSFYLLDNGAIYIYNLNKHKNLGMCFFEPELQAVPKFFLVGKSGLYMVAVHNTEDGGCVGAEGATGKPPVQKIELYQVIESRMEFKLINDTSDIAIFYGDNYHYLAVGTDDWGSLDGGGIYKEYVCSSSVDNEIMLNYLVFKYWNVHEPCYGIFFAKLDEGRSDPVVVGVSKMPQVWPPPPSMWFQPNFV
ncbi:F-box protein SKIP23-like [Carex rostrata]